MITRPCLPSLCAALMLAACGGGGGEAAAPTVAVDAIQLSGAPFEWCCGNTFGSNFRNSDGMGTAPTYAYGPPDGKYATLSNGWLMFDARGADVAAVRIQLAIEAQGTYELWGAQALPAGTCPTPQIAVDCIGMAGMTTIAQSPFANGFKRIGSGTTSQSFDALGSRYFILKSAG